jgi:hypothetical protein
MGRTVSAPADIARLLADLGRAGVELAPHPSDPDRLRFKCPGGAANVPPDLSDRLRRHRAAMLGLLTNEYTPDGEEAGYVYAERLGVADELAMPTHPGSSAWLVAIGEAMMGAQCT